MKIGRNDPCHCGSGKKYKKCCLDKDGQETQDIQRDKHYFNLKGKNAETLIHDLAEKSFFIDWCYKNPEWEDRKELCDLLIVFNDIVIIWQIKDLKRQKNGRYSQSKVEKNLSQLSGAKRKLFDLKKPIELFNPRRGKELFFPDKIKRVYLISALIGEGEDYYSLLEKYKGKEIHVINRETAEILLNELDTIQDFTNYLNERESLLFSANEKDERKIILLGGERDILAYYLMNERNFSQFKEANMILLEEGCWEALMSKQEYLRKKEEDEISYIWDEIINRAHTCGEGYETVAKELARPHRFERRWLSKNFFEAHHIAHNQKENNFYQRTMKGDGITYHFVFMDAPSREARRNFLMNLCFVVRDLNRENKKVLGIATERKIYPECSYDFCLLDFPEWTKENEAEAKKIKETTGLFKNQNWRVSHEDEYPTNSDN
jgi:hypothetical protein